MAAARTAALLAIYAAWLRSTWRAKLSLRSWGPRWLARWLSLPLPWLAALLGISAETRWDGVTADVLATIGPCVVTLSPHGMGFGHTLLTPRRWQGRRPGGGHLCGCGTCHAHGGRRMDPRESGHFFGESSLLRNEPQYP